MQGNVFKLYASYTIANLSSKLKSIRKRPALL